VRAGFRQFKTLLSSPAGLALVALVSVVVALVFSAGVATAVQYTRSERFCAKSCHEMERTVYAEYAHSKHYKNTTCAQCHAAQDTWQHVAKNEAAGTSHLWAHVVDRDYLPGRFEARRADLAKKVLADFKTSNARECKGCHAYATLAVTGPSQMARRDHASAMKTDANCLECHQGVVHSRMDAPASYDLP
jgi:nitrate/TMAO reductase-like tetraheme cytochrome c subunit